MPEIPEELEQRVSQLSADDKARLMVALMRRGEWKRRLGYLQ